MKVFVIGSGGREHAIVWRLSRDPSVKEILCAPGNPGIEKNAHCVEIEPNNISQLVSFARDEKFDLVLVGPEAPLAQGLADALREEKIPVVGVSQSAARLESSKAFAKSFMKRHGLPTAEYQSFTNILDAERFIQSQSSLNFLVVKADGLAAGKGVTVCETRDEVLSACRRSLVEESFGESGKRVIVEEKLQGNELSVIALCDGKTIVPFAVSRDHKRLLDGDQGPNTGGMGAYGPIPEFNETLKSQLQSTIFDRFLAGLESDQMAFRGLIYFGLMLTSEGLRVLEFNVRFGDPESQAILPLFEHPFADLLLQTALGKIERPLPITPASRFSVCIVLSSRGYPEKPQKGQIITGIESAVSNLHTLVFHAGTGFDETGRLVTHGGRVLGITATGENLDSALQTAYCSVEKIHFEGMHYRRDIARRQNVQSPSTTIS